MAARSEDEIFRQIRDKLYVAVVSDVLDSLGFMNQAMSPRIRPLDDDKMLLGYARTGLYHDVYEVKEGENPYELEIALVDDLKPREVTVTVDLKVGDARATVWTSDLTHAYVHENSAYSS